MNNKRECNSCRKIKNIEAYGFCESCWKKIQRRTSPIFFLKHLHVKLKQRCTNKNYHNYLNYKDKDFLTQQEFLDHFAENKEYLAIYFNWVDSGWKSEVSPSVDRIDSSKGYTLDNIQILPTYINVIKDKQKFKISVLKDKKEIGIFNSIDEVSTKLQVSKYSVFMALAKVKSKVSGFTFKKVVI